MVKKYIAFTVFVLFAIHSYANSYYGKHISIDNGLSQSSVTCIQYSNNGSLWIGTRFGLNEYRNGQVRYFLGNKSAGLEGGYINNLYTDESARLWVMTDKGVFLYNDTSDSFSSIDREIATCMVELGDTLYIGGNSGISTYSKTSGELHKGNSEVWTDVLDLYDYKGQLLSIDRRLGVSLKQNGHSEMLSIPEIEGVTIMAASLSGDTLILSILGEGLLLYDLAGRNTIKFLGQGKNGLGRDLILCSTVIDGKLWLGTDGNGIQIMDMATGSVENFYDNISLNTGTEVPKSVTTIYPDPLGNIWLGGVHYGVTGLKATSISTFLPEDVINCFYASSDGRLYIGTDGDGLYTYSEGKAERIPSTAGMKITSIADYDSGHLLFFAYNSGFHILDRKTGRFRQMLIIDRKTNDAECLYGNAPEICSLGDGRMVLFAMNNYVHNPKDGSFRLLFDMTEGDAKDLKTLYGEGHSTYTYTKTGIYRINLGEMRLERIHDCRTSGESSINCVIVADNKMLYGTDYGLYSLNMETGENSIISSDLITKVTELCSDEDGTIWIGADNALFAYRDGSIELLGENRGVAANEFTASILKDGTVYFGGANGFLEIADESKGATQRPDVEKHFMLHNVSINGKTIQANNGKISVPYKYQRLDISVSLFGADPLERMIYRYSITGPTSYSFDMLDNTVQIPSLKSGVYEIRMLYPIEMGLWSDPQTILVIKVNTPWYSSIWMVLIYISCLIGGVAAFIILMRKKMMRDLAEKLSQRDSLFVTKFEKYIAEHLSENDLNVEQIAADLAMSRATLYSKVKNAYACGIGEYIEEKRMDKAREMLENGNESIAEIAEAIGYSTPRYFSMRFKKAVGESPLSYRKKRKSR